MQNRFNGTYVYIAHPDYIADLQAELGDVTQVIGNCIFSQKSMPDCVFAQDIWLNPKMVKISSINHAARILQQEGVIWHPHVLHCARRTMLIAGKIPTWHAKAPNWQSPYQGKPIGCFSLLDETTLLYATQRTSVLPDGVYNFLEDKQNPPNRAYLKLWEALYRLGRYPKKGDTALDLGASPGGWTYVLQTLGAHVTAVDKAPLAPHIAQLAHVTSLKQSAFALNPNDFQGLHWFVCDMACYPEKLLEFVKKWIAHDNTTQFVCTLKLQGVPNFDVIRAFQAIPNSTVVHLYQNKHELTWLYPGYAKIEPLCAIQELNNGEKPHHSDDS